MTQEMKKLTILGAGESGVGAAILGKDKGWDVFVSDAGKIHVARKAELDKEGISYEEGGHTLDRILQSDEVVKSPGIPLDASVIKALREKGIPVISEIELAGRYANGAKMVCITGSNGKTTTTTLIHHILTEAGLDAGLAGNVGKSLALQVARNPHEIYVVELSSFMLDTMYDFRANIAVLMNITPDHMDRYDYKFENYVASKFRILQNMQPTDAFIYWHDDPVITAQLKHVTTEARKFPFAEHLEEGVAAWVDDEHNVQFTTDVESMSMPRAQLALTGLHNIYNSMASGLAACILDVNKDDIRKALSDFNGVEHRLEYITTIDGVRYINDSKATNVNSTWYALESMPKDKTTVLILGGTDKGNDYSEILPLVRERVKAIVAMGKDNKKILDFFAKEMPEMHDTHSVDECLAACRAIAKEGDTVLLSPCCASFDLFHCFEERGAIFKEAVRKLAHHK